MTLDKLVCLFKTRGKHIDTPSLNGDHHCTECGTYLYTLYNFKESLRAMRNASKMWWETPE